MFSSTTKSEPSDSYVPSKSSPHNSPFAFNSGSPTLNAKGELCGLLFDGTYESLGSDFVVDENITRSIHVDAVYMLWVMDAVDGAHNLLREVNVPVHFGNASTPATGR